MFETLLAANHVDELIGRLTVTYCIELDITCAGELQERNDCGGLGQSLKTKVCLIKTLSKLSPLEEEITKVRHGDRKNKVGLDRAIVMQERLQQVEVQVRSVQLVLGLYGHEESRLGITVHKESFLLEPHEDRLKSGRHLLLLGLNRNEGRKHFNHLKAFECQSLIW